MGGIRLGLYACFEDVRRTRVALMDPEAPVPDPPTFLDRSDPRTFSLFSRCFAQKPIQDAPPPIPFELNAHYQPLRVVRAVGYMLNLDRAWPRLS